MDTICEPTVIAPREKHLSPTKRKHVREDLSGMLDKCGMEIVGVLAELLEERQKSPVPAARLRGEIAKEKYKQFSPSFSTEEYARNIGVTRQAVLKRLHNGTLIGWQEHKQKAFRIPAWQFGDSLDLLPGMASVLDVLNAAGLSGWGKVVFFLQKRASLKGGTPLELLKKGRVQHVVELAENYVS